MIQAPGRPGQASSSVPGLFQVEVASPLALIGLCTDLCTRRGETGTDGGDQR
jgi:hypothetical protein